MAGNGVFSRRRKHDQMNDSQLHVLAVDDRLVDRKVAKRKLTLKKKASELSTLCDVSVCLIISNTDGSVETWPENSDTVKSVLTRYRSSPQKSKRLKISPNQRKDQSPLSEDDFLSSLSENALIDLWKDLEFKSLVLRERMNVLQMMEEVNAIDDTNLWMDFDVGNFQASPEAPFSLMSAFDYHHRPMIVDDQIWSLDQYQLHNNNFQHESFENFMPSEDLIFPLQQEASFSGSVWPNFEAATVGSDFQGMESAFGLFHP